MINKLPQAVLQGDDPAEPVTLFSGYGKDFNIESVTSTLVDIPTVRCHTLAQTSVTMQNYVLVKVKLRNGVEGYGEAATLGGPRWSEESVEAIKANIDTYLAPAVIGHRADLFVQLETRLRAAAKRNNAAKGAMESAFFDAVGKSLNLPVTALLGGRVVDRFPVVWTLGLGDVEGEIAEGEEKLARRLHKTFKVKVGAGPPEQDMNRLRRLAQEFEGRADLIVDANQAWDETTSIRLLPELAELKIHLVEQPVAAWNIGAMSRLRRLQQRPPLMADECVFDEHDMLAVAQASAADAISLKLVKHGGLLALKRVGAIAEAAGIGLYGGCLLESSVGAAAHLQAFATFSEIRWGVEHFGPQILTDDLVETPLQYEDFNILLPEGPGMGVIIDQEKVRRFSRT
jgi:muconate cycloisomerase